MTRTLALVLAAALIASGPARAESDPHAAPAHAPAAPHGEAQGHGPPPPPPPPEGEAPVVPDGPPVLRIPAPGGEVVLTGERDQRSWNDLRFAPLRRVGDTVYLSGVIIGPRQGEGHDVPAFKAQARRAFFYLQSALKSVGLTFADVASLQTYHVWSGPNFSGDKAAQIDAFLEVKDEFFKAPYPAWTAVGVSELLSAAGVVEVQLTAHVPAPAPALAARSLTPAAPRKPAPRRPRPAAHAESPGRDDAGH